MLPATRFCAAAAVFKTGAVAEPFPAERQDRRSVPEGMPAAKDSVGGRAGLREGGQGAGRLHLLIPQPGMLLASGVPLMLKRCRHP